MNITRMFKAGKSRLFYAINGRPVCEVCAFESDAVGVVSAPVNSLCFTCGYEVN